MPDTPDLPDNDPPDDTTVLDDDGRSVTDIDVQRTPRLLPTELRTDEPASEGTPEDGS